MFESPKPITPQEYEFIRQTVYEYSRINLGPSKKELVMARLSKRLRALKIPAYKDYIDLLRSPQGKDEMTNLIDSISTNHTYFFREIQHFNFLVETILPDVCKAGSGMSKTFRVWSAATSSGEEPYSIALVLEEYLKTKAQGWNWHIQCTDISTRILKKAQEGIFVKERLDKIRKDWLSKYFEKGHGEFDGQFRVKADLKRNMSFTCLNLLSPSYPFRESYNVIFCRNVMIYFDRPTQEELVSKLEKLLLPGGYLMIGHAESLTAIKHNLKMIKPAIYRKPL
ncbi:MAG: protein-glutamate O-methyltransferase CheR [Opitutales bacterium]|nr:protein-glutamate O-methyltransferase CheR [Opitutales bacterium]